MSWLTTAGTAMVRTACGTVISLKISSLVRCLAMALSPPFGSFYDVMIARTRGICNGAECVVYYGQHTQEG